MSYSAPPKQMKQKDYFQPMGQRDKVPLWTDELKDQIKVGIALGTYLGMIFAMIGLPMFFTNYPHIEQSLDEVGYGVVRACRPDCGHCEQDWHRHYQKAWRKVK